MSALPHLAKNPHPKGNGSHPGHAPNAKHTPSGSGGSGGSGDPANATGGGLLHSFGHFLITHPIAIPVLLIAALIGVNYGWSQLRKKQAARGVAVRPLGAITRDTLRFAIKEDRRPLHAKTPWLTGTRLYAALLTLAVLSCFPGLPQVPPGFPGLLLAVVLYARANKIFKARRNIVQQMFDVATGECRYPRGSELAPWSYVQVQNWTNLVQPGTTIISIPAAYQSEDFKTRDKFERQFNGTVSEENAWTYTWESAKNRIQCTPAAFLPTMAKYPGPGAKWNEFVLGASGDDKQAVWDVSTFPHALICGPTGSGKLLDLSTPIATPTGWSAVGDIKVGDHVFDLNGNPTKVVDLSPIITSAQSYEVQFSDGSVITADADHLWWTETRAVRESRWTERRKPRVRRPLISEEGLARLRAALDTSERDGEITIRQAADLAGVGATAPWLLDIAREIGPVGEVRPVVHFHYNAQIVESSQWVRRWNVREVFAALAAKPARKGWAWEPLRPTFAALAVSEPERTLSATEFADLLSVPRAKATDLLTQSKVPCTKTREKVAQVIPEKTVERTGNWVRTYSADRFLSRLIEHGQRSAWDKRHLQSRGAVRTTEEIRATLRTRHGHANHSIPVAHALMLPEADLPLAPYTLGVWLGDGTSWHGSFVGIDHEVARNVEADGYCLSERTDAPATEKNPLYRTWTVLGAMPVLRHMGLLKTGVEQGHTKRIPMEYLRASREQRQALLAGLLDTDGTVGNKGCIEITQVNRALAHDIRELALSLGYRATIREGRAVLDGVDFGPTWTVSWTCEESPFRLARKSEAHRSRSHFHAERNSHRYIVDVRPVASVPMRCIMVDSADRLFLAGESMIPTHNSVLQRMILFHALAHSDTWRIVGVDPKMVEMGWLKKYPSVLKIALTLEEGVEVVKSVRDEMTRRYEEMSDPAVGVNHFLSLPDPPKALLLMIDETFNFLSPEGIKSDEGKERDAMHAQAASLLGEIARLGRAAGIHLVCATQRPDATVIKGEMKNNLDCRIAAGRLDTTPSLMVLDSEAATRLPKIKGRGMIRLGGEVDTFQGYFAEQSWFDDWLAQQQAVAAGPGAGPGEPVPDEGARGSVPSPGEDVLDTGAPEDEAAPGVDPTDTRVSPDTPVRPDGSRGLKGLAARAAAKAQARAARLAAEAEADTVDGPGSAGPAPDLLPSPPAVDEHDGSDPSDFDADVDLDLDSFLNAQGYGEGDGLDGDFDDDFDLDEVLDEGPEDESDYPAEEAPAPAPKHDSSPAATPDRPVLPQPVQQAAPRFRPGDPLPNYAASKKSTTAPAPVQPAPTQPTPAPPNQPTAPAGLPIQPPRGLPTRPPTP